MFYTVKNYVYGEKLELGRTAPETGIILEAEGIRIDSGYFPFKDYKIIFSGSRHNLIIDTALTIQGFEFIMQRVLETKYDRMEVTCK